MVLTRQKGNYSIIMKTLVNLRERVALEAGGFVIGVLLASGQTYVFMCQYINYIIAKYVIAIDSFIANILMLKCFILAITPHRENYFHNLFSKQARPQNVLW